MFRFFRAGVRGRPIAPLCADRAPDRIYAFARAVRDRTTDCGKEARNNTTQTQSKTMSLNMNSPVKFQAIGSVDKLHLTTSGVVKKNDHVMAKVTIPISEPMADKIGLNAPATRSAAIPNSTTPR